MARPPFNNNPVTAVTALPDGMIVYNNRPVIGVVIVDPSTTLYNNQPVLGVVANEGLNRLSVAVAPNPMIEGQPFTLTFNPAPTTVTVTQGGIELALSGTGTVRTGTAGVGSVEIRATKAEFPELVRVIETIKKVDPVEPQAIFTRTATHISVQDAGAFPEFTIGRTMTGINAMEVA